MRRVPLEVIVSGLELPDKLRQGLGAGNVVSAEDLAKRMKPYDTDGDGALSRAELHQFLLKHKIGGAWYSQVVAKTLWKLVEQRGGEECPTITLPVLAQIIHFVMSRGPRPERRYQITCDGMMGYKPLEPLRRPAEKISEAKPRGTPAPRASAPSTPQRSTTTTPGRGGGAAAAAAAAARGGARRPGPRRPGPRR